MQHNLKIRKPYYDAVKAGIKRFEIRNNNRGYQKGDEITLEEINTAGIRTGAANIEAVITYVSNFHQKENWVVFGFRIQNGTP
jgi:ASC-1-like (ASCH) protein